MTEMKGKTKPNNTLPATVLEIVVDVDGGVSWNGGTCHATAPPRYDEQHTT